MPPACPGDEQEAPLAICDAQDLSDERAEGTAHLHRRTLSPAGAARAERENRHHGLHESDSFPYSSLGVVKRIDDRVAAAPAGLGGEPSRDRAGEEGSRGRDHDEQQRTERRTTPQLAQNLLAAGAKRDVARPPL